MQPCYSPATARLQPGYSPATALLQPFYSPATALLQPSYSLLQPCYSPATGTGPGTDLRGSLRDARSTPGWGGRLGARRGARA